jgi:IS5 family transposase
MFKSLVLASLYSLSDEQLEFQIEDRRSFQRFVGLSDAKHAPHRNSFWLFREELKELKLTETLFKEFNHQLDRAGLIARKGQLIDDQLRQSAGAAQYAGRKKAAGATMVTKNHVNVDNAHKLVRKYPVTDASVHDSQRLETLLDAGNTSRSVWADSAYRSEATEADLKAQGYRSRIHRKGVRGKALTHREKQGNKTRSQTRCRVEQVFAWIAQWGGKAVRSIGLARAEVRIGFMNLVYNMRRFCTLQRVAAS